MTGRNVLLFFLFLFSLAAVPYAGCSENLIEELHPDPVRKGYQFTYILYLDYDKPSLIGITAPVFPKALKLVRGPYIRSYYLASNTGKSKKKTKISYTFAALKTGRFVLGSFKLKTPRGTFTTVPRIVSIGIYKNKKIYIPFESSWVQKGKTFYTGQAVPLVAVVSNLPDIVIFDKVEVPLPSNGLFTRIDDPGPITDVKVGFQKLYTIPVAGYLYTPSRPGKVKIPRIRISGSGITSFSRPLYLTIKTPPERIRSTGAIGDFKREFTVHPDTLEVNGTVTVSVEVKGTGNLNYLEIPRLNVQGLTLIGEKDTQRYTGDLSGYTGMRGKIFTYTASSEGKKVITIPPFPFLNPATGSVQSIPEKTAAVKVSGSASNSESSRDPFARFTPETVSGSTFREKSGRYLDVSNYLWLLPGPLVFLVFFFAGKKKTTLILLVMISLAGSRLGASTVDDGISSYKKGEYSQAAGMYLDALKEYPGSSSLYYDLALSYYKMGMTGKSVYAAQIAVRYSPLNKKYAALLHVIEKASGVKYPVAVPGSIYPDTYLFILSLLLNGGAFIGVFYFIKKKNIYFIGMVLLFGFSAVALGGLIHSADQWHHQYGVARLGTVEVKKIPRGSSTTGFTLKEGETVSVVDSSGMYIFIENGIGVKGWVKADNLLVFGGRNDPYKVLAGAE